MSDRARKLPEELISLIEESVSKMDAEQIEAFSKDTADIMLKSRAAPSLDTAHFPVCSKCELPAPSCKCNPNPAAENQADAARIGKIRLRAAGEVASMDYERWYGEDIPYLLAELERREKAECAARKAGTSDGSYPQDCDWPFCGCDERASKVMDTLLECGWIGNKEAEMLKRELDAEAGRVRINFRIMENLGLVNSIDGWINQRAETAEQERDLVRTLLELRDETE